MKEFLNARRFQAFVWIALIAIVLPMPAFAAGAGMPWEAPLQQILNSVEGPVSKIVAVLIIISTGMTLAFGETSGGFRRLIQLVFFISIAFAASSFFLTFFGFAGGALVARRARLPGSKCRCTGP